MCHSRDKSYNHNMLLEAVVLDVIDRTLRTCDYDNTF